MIEEAVRNNKPVRIGVNWGSLDQELLSNLMDKNSKLKKPLDADAVTKNALIISALEMKATTKNNLKKSAIAINEISLLREGRQAASLKIINGKKVLQV